jgi:hypothetical protein
MKKLIRKRRVATKKKPKTLILNNLSRNTSCLTLTTTKTVCRQLSGSAKKFQPSDAFTGEVHSTN